MSWSRERVVEVSWNMTVSVISRISRSGGSPATARMRRRSSTKVCSASVRREVHGQAHAQAPVARSRPARCLGAGFLEHPRADRQDDPGLLGQRHEFAGLHQPIIDLATGVAVGVEALVRWQHPTRGLVEPSEFVPLAEETGVILPIGAWVLEEACTQAARWSSFGRRGLGVSLTVNLSAQQLAEQTFVDDLRRILAVAGLPPDRLILEMTETVMFHDTSTTLSRLQDIRDLGVRIAIDDFGTGYSSLGYLRRFRVDLLKIAREFVGSADRQEEWAFAGAIVALGRTLGLSIIAEGIEEQGQLERLRALGCEFGQGYLFARPQTADVTELYLASKSDTRGTAPTAMLRPAASPVATGLQARVAV